MPIDDYLGKIEGIRSSNRVFRKHTNLSDNDLEDYIILESKSHDSHSYPDLLVSKKRSHLSLHWFDAHKALNQENSFMLNLRQFVDYLGRLNEDFSSRISIWQAVRKTTGKNIGKEDELRKTIG